MEHENLNTEKTANSDLDVVKHSYLDKLKEDLIISEQKFNLCKTYSEMWKFYRAHIEWLKSKISEYKFQTN